MEKQQRCFMLIDNDERNQSNEKKMCTIVVCEWIDGHNQWLHRLDNYYGCALRINSVFLPMKKMGAF